MIISKEIIYRQGDRLFSRKKYKEVITSLISLLTDTKHRRDIALAIEEPTSYRDKSSTLTCVIPESYWEQIRPLYDFIVSTDYTLRFSNIDKSGNVFFRNIDIPKDRLFDWYYAEEYKLLRNRLPYIDKSVTYDDFINLYVPDTGYNKDDYISWDNKEVFMYMEPTRLYNFIRDEVPVLNSRISSNIAAQNNQKYTYYAVGSIYIKVVDNNNQIKDICFPPIYYDLRIEETQLNRYINDYIDSLSEDEGKKLENEIFEYNKPTTAFVDIETNVGEVEEGELPWDIFNKVVNSMNNKLAHNEEDISDDGGSEDVISYKQKEDDKPKYGYSDKSDEEIDEMLNDEKDTFSSPSDPYQPINTISIALGNNILVLSRRKYLSKDDIALCQKDIDNHFRDIKAYKDRPFKFYFLQFDTEYQLIEFFLSKVVRSVSAMTGWNFFGYDWPYIINRYFRILRYWLGYNYSAKNISKMAVPVNINNDMQKELRYLLKYKKYDMITDKDLFNAIMSVLIADNLTGYVVKRAKTISRRETPLLLFLPNNKIIYDYLEIYNKWDKTVPIKETLSLDWTAQTVLDVPKLPHELGFDEFYRTQFRTYVVYNAIDSILVSLLDGVIKTSDIYMSFAATMMIEPNYALSSVRPVTNVISNFAYRKKLIFPKKLSKDKRKKEDQFAGAYVKAPVPGLYKSVIALDYASLYPSTIRTMAISPENLIYQGTMFSPSPEQMKKFIDDPYGAYNEYIDCHIVKDKLEKEYEENVPVKEQLPREERVYTPSGAIFRKTEDALMPAVLTHYYMERKKAKKRMKAAIHNLNVVETTLLKRFPNTKYKIDF